MNILVRTLHTGVNSITSSLFNDVVNNSGYFPMRV
jgi:hypothetical protein